MSKSYEIGVGYDVEDKATVGLRGIADAARNADKQIISLGTAFKALSAYVGVRGIWEVAKKGFIEFNSYLEQTNTTLAAQMNMTGVIKSWTDASKAAKMVRDNLYTSSLTNPGTFQDAVNFAQRIGPAFYKAGASIRQVQDLAKNGVGIAKATGADPSTLSYEMSESLVRPVTAQMFQLKLLLSMGNKTQEQFNKMSQQGKLNFYQRVFSSTEAQNALKAYGNTWESQVQGLSNRFQLLMSSAGDNIFGKLKDDLRDLNVWIDGHKGEIKSWATSFSHGVEEAFNRIKGGVQWLEQHQGLIRTAMTAAQYIGYARLAGFALPAAGGAAATATNAAMASSQLSFPFAQQATPQAGGLLQQTVKASRELGAVALSANMANGALRGFILSGLSPFQNKWITYTQTFLGALSGIPGPIGGLAMAANLAATALMGIYSWWKTKNDNAMGLIKQREGLQQLGIQYGSTGRLNDAASQAAMGTLKANHIFEMEKAKDRIEAIHRLSYENVSGKYMVNSWEGGHNHMVMSPAGIAQRNAIDAALMFAYKAKNAQDEKDKKLLDAKAPSINIENVNVEVKGNDDPDRFALGFGRVISNSIKKPVNSKYAFRDR